MIDSCSTESTPCSSFLKRLVNTSQVNIVVDNACSGESAVYHNLRRRKGLDSSRKLPRTNSFSGSSGCRWSSDESPKGMARSISCDLQNNRGPITRKHRRHSMESSYNPPSYRYSKKKSSSKKHFDDSTFHGELGSTQFCATKSKPSASIDLPHTKYVPASTNAIPKPPKRADTDLASSLVSTIERLSVRAALALTSQTVDYEESDDSAWKRKEMANEIQ